MIDFNFRAFGKSFKILRIDRGYSVNELSKDILSPSSLRKFEEGLVDPSFTKVVMLLDRMHISMNEFIKFSFPQYIPEYKSFLAEISESYNEDDVETMKKIYQRENTLLRQRTDFFYLISTSTTAALIKNLDPDFVVDKELIDSLNDYLMKTEFWGDFQISIFGNCSMIIPSKMIYLISREVLSKTRSLRSVDYNVHNAIAALENGIEIISDRQEYSVASQLLDLLSDFNIPNEDLTLRLKFIFFKNLFLKDEHKAFEQNTKLIESLRLMGSNQLASAYDQYMINFYRQKNV